MVLTTCSFITLNNPLVLSRTINEMYDNNISIKNCVINNFGSNLCINLNLELDNNVNLCKIIMGHQMIRENLDNSNEIYKTNEIKIFMNNNNKSKILSKILDVIRTNGYYLDYLEFNSKEKDINLRIKNKDNLSINQIEDSFNIK